MDWAVLALVAVCVLLAAVSAYLADYYSREYTRAKLLALKKATEEKVRPD